MANPTEIYEAKKAAEEAFDREHPVYLVRHFSANSDMQDWLNEINPLYELVSIADTNSYCTAAVKRKFPYHVWATIKGHLEGDTR